LAEFDISAIANALSAAVLDPARWESALEDISSKTGSFGAIMFPLRGALPYVPATRSMEESFEVYVRDGWVSRDERTIRGVNKLIRAGIITDHDIMSEAAIKKSPYYQDFIARNNFRSWAAIKVGTGEHIWGLTLHRTLQQEQFSASELEALQQLSVQLSGTTEIAIALGFARGEAALSAFDSAGKASLLLNRSGEVVRVNEMAGRLFDADVAMVHGRLHCSNKAATDRFDRALKRLLWSSDRSGVAPISLPRPGRSPVMVHLMRSFQLADTPLSSFHAIAVLVDPDARLVPAMESLKTAFDLTPAEARLAIALQSGADIQSEAARLNLSPETLRKQLRSIFAKTRLGRQSDLIAMLSNFLPRI
jgi:DNA-binding CsgD family transcriptional regulator